MVAKADMQRPMSVSGWPVDNEPADRSLPMTPLPRVSGAGSQGLQTSFDGSKQDLATVQEADAASDSSAPHGASGSGEQQRVGTAASGSGSVSGKGGAAAAEGGQAVQASDGNGPAAGAGAKGEPEPEAAGSGAAAAAAGGSTGTDAADADAAAGPILDMAAPGVWPPGKLLPMEAAPAAASAATAAAAAATAPEPVDFDADESALWPTFGGVPNAALMSLVESTAAAASAAPVGSVHSRGRQVSVQNIGLEGMEDAVVRVHDVDHLLQPGTAPSSRGRTNSSHLQRGSPMHTPLGGLHAGTPGSTASPQQLTSRAGTAGSASTAGGSSSMARRAALQQMQQQHQQADQNLHGQHHHHQQQQHPQGRLPSFGSSGAVMGGGGGARAAAAAAAAAVLQRQRSFGAISAGPSADATPRSGVASAAAGGGGASRGGSAAVGSMRPGSIGAAGGGDAPPGSPFARASHLSQVSQSHGATPRSPYPGSSASRPISPGRSPKPGSVQSDRQRQQQLLGLGDEDLETMSYVPMHLINADVPEPPSPQRSFSAFDAAAESAGLGARPPHPMMPPPPLPPQQRMGANVMPFGERKMTSGEGSRQSNARSASPTTAVAGSPLPSPPLGLSRKISGGSPSLGGKPLPVGSPASDAAASQAVAAARRKAPSQSPAPLGGKPPSSLSKAANGASPAPSGAAGAAGGAPGSKGSSRASSGQQPRGGGVMPAVQDPAELIGMMTVKGALRDEPEASVEQPVSVAHKPKRPAGFARINFKPQLPAAIVAGGAGAIGRVREGLARRILAAQQNMFGPPPFKRKPIPRPMTPEGIKLDGFALLEAGDDELPERIQAVRLSHRNIADVEVADLVYFVSLRVADLADNRLPDLACLSNLPNLALLSLASNRLKTLGNFAPDMAFQDLQTLDLSYNSLDGEEILGEGAPLAYLPRLRELNLSGNGLTRLPTAVGPLPALRLLKLADNKLTGACLGTLARLPALENLSLSRNLVAEARGEDLEEAAGSGMPFPRLAVLDLTHNRVGSQQAVAPLRNLPALQRLLLAGNPLAVVHAQVQKRAAQRAAAAAAAAVGGAPQSQHHLAAQHHAPGVDGSDDDHMHHLDPSDASEFDPLFVFEAVPAQGPRPTVASVLVGGGGRFIRVAEPLHHKEAAAAAATAAVANVTEEAVGDAFERIDQAIEAWHLNTVPEEEEEYEDEEEGEADPDGTFLTGIGITEKPARRPKGSSVAEGELGPEPSDRPTDAEPDRPVWEDVEDPTERLALALGLDPRRLAIYTGQLTTDATGSVNALRFALAHPAIADPDEGLAPPHRHLGLTAAAAAKRRPRLNGVPMHQHQRLEPLDTSSIPLPPDAKMVRVQTIEGMLEGMKARLKQLEGSLGQRLAEAGPAATVVAADAAGAQAPGGAPAAGAGGGLSPEMSGLMGDDLDSPGSPQRMRGIGEAFQPRGALLQGGGTGNWDDDAGSEMSALPDDVIDAIENSDPSDRGSDDEDGGGNNNGFGDSDDDEMAGGGVGHHSHSQHHGNGNGPVRSASGRSRPGGSSLSTSPVPPAGGAFMQQQVARTSAAGGTQGRMSATGGGASGRSSPDPLPAGARATGGLGPARAASGFAGAAATGGSGTPAGGKAGGAAAAALGYA